MQRLLMSDTQDVYRITVLPPVHRWAGVCPVYRALWFFGLSICLGLRGLFGRYWWVCHSWWASVGLLIFELLVGVLWNKWKGTYKSWMLTTSTWKKKKREFPFESDRKTVTLTPTRRKSQNHLFPRGSAFTVNSADLGTRTSFGCAEPSISLSHLVS